MTKPSESKEALEALYQKFIAIPAPKGLAACEDVQFEIDEFGGYVAGLACSLLAGQSIDRSAINAGDDIAVRLAQCEEKMAQLRAYLELERKLLRMVLDVSAP